MPAKVNSQTRKMPGTGEIASHARYKMGDEDAQVVVYVCTGCYDVLATDACGSCWNDGDADIIPYTYTADMDTVNVGDLR
jgi:hypothetical protein